MDRKTISLNISIKDLDRLDNMRASFSWRMSRTDAIIFLLDQWEKKENSLDVERSDKPL